ncbi:glycosyl hydrolase [Citrobacter koseri]|nr:glycosyl hydrolase [Citrobacter koseri]
MRRPYTLKYQYLLGRDLLVAPVHEQGRRDWTLYLPEDNWINAWTGETLRGGRDYRGRAARQASGLLPCRERVGITVCLFTHYLIRLARGETHGHMEKNNESNVIQIRRPYACRLKKNLPMGWVI